MNHRDKIERRPDAGVLGLAVLALCAVSLASAQGNASTGQATRAARLSSVDGMVQLSQGNQVLADPALVNTPLFEGTEVAASAGGRAEIQFEDGSLARLSPESALTLKVLRAGDTEIVLEGGLAYFELQGDSQTNHILVRFGDSVVTTNGLAILRINMDNPPGELAVFSGNAHVEHGSDLARGGVLVDLHGGEDLTLDGADPTRYNLAETIEPDSWDGWNSDRDQVLAAQAGSRTSAVNSSVDNSNPAWSDLDANGAWYNVPGQGNIWSPYDASNAGWDPYGNGYWMWTPNFGYVWVSGEDWGYLPYQCGSWNYYSGFGWGWGLGLGGCQWWWGGAGWAFNIGNAPGGYRPPVRPHPRPEPPHLLPAGAGKLGANPVIAVNRSSAFESGELPLRDRNTAVVIAGQTVQPLRSLLRRQQYDHSGAPGVAPRAPNGARTAYSRVGTNGEATGEAVPIATSTHTSSRSGNSSAAKSPATSKPASSSGGSASHVSGGGGGASHSGSSSSTTTSSGSTHH